MAKDSRLQELGTFLDGLSDEGYGRVMRKLRRAALVWPMSPAEEVAADPEAAYPQRPYSKLEAASYEIHARVLAHLDVAREAWSEASRALAKAKSPGGANIWPPQKPDLAEVARREEALDDARQVLERALADEVEARPHRVGYRPRFNRPTYPAPFLAANDKERDGMIARLRGRLAG